jgi:putative endonuclease
VAVLGAHRLALGELFTLAYRFGAVRKTPRHLQTGLRGELEAMFFLKRLGFTVVERRWQSPDHRGDLDLVTFEGDTLCFVEVKTRTARDLTPAALAVDAEKRRTLERLAGSYLRRVRFLDRPEKVLVRFDIVSVYLLASGVECEILRDCFRRHTSGPRGV